MSNSNNNEDKTSIVPSDTFKQKMEEAKTSPPNLVLLMGPIDQIGRQWPITRSMQIGRMAGLDICVPDRSMSRRHAELKLIDGKVFVEDLGSSNGTEVAGEKLPEGQARELKDNDQIKLGNAIFKFLGEGNIEATTNDQAHTRAITDPLTRIHNKLAFLEKIEQTFKKAQLTDVNLSLIVFDLDKFKDVNDTYGHQAGDYVLQELAAVVKNKLRPSDFFSRYGGEEFTILLSGGDVNVAYDLAERLRKAVEGHDFVYEGITLPVTISAGVASIDSSMDKWEDLFNKADKASYESKKNGRNQVSRAS